MLPLVSYVAQPWIVTDDRRRQTPATVTSLAPYTMCRRASNNKPRRGLLLLARPFRRQQLCSRCHSMAKHDETTSWLILAHRPHYVKTRRLQNRKCINVLHCHQSRTEPRPQIRCTENFVNFGHVLSDLCKQQTDRQTDRHSDLNRPTSLPYRARSNNNNNNNDRICIKQIGTLKNFLDRV